MKIYLYFIIAGLLIVDAVLVVNNRQAPSQNKKPIETLNRCRDLSCFKESFLDKNIQGIKLVMFIPNKTCPHCSQYMLDFLAHHNTLARFTKVVFIGPYFNEQYKRSPNIKYKTVDNMSAVFKKNFLLIKPGAVIMDKHNAHLLYEITPGDGFMKEKMQAFWVGAHQFYANLYDNKSLSLLESTK